ncbi:MAG: hypothetical protein KDC52_14640 [Ignavibacteriae bacterium]|nr:hypothetical protein [Ignavibacteriota bacterium]MCB0752706.1 hypothetical protein [Ignavibacteriota bacterium]MCB9248081.1 hypothetical protein [Ignavibacteriales bacterium]
MEFNQNFQELKKNLYIVLENLNNINDENFDSNMNKIKNLAHGIEERKNKVKNSLITEEYKSERDEYQTAIKLINEKFDSIIEKKKEVQKKISMELSKTINQKKLINYQR